VLIGVFCLKKSKTESAFCQLCNRGGLNRFAGQTTIPMKISDGIVLGRRSPAGVATAEFEVRFERRSDPEDFPWIYDSVPIVSDRMRAFLEANAPEQLEFLPIRATFRAKPLPGARYWIMVCRHIIECIDFERSKYSPIEGAPHRLSFSRIELFEPAIPKKVVIFRSEYDPFRIYIRDSFRKSLVASGLTGCQFYDVNIF
jgi:hypothetical protein